jgi:hypothetical protein
MTPSCTASNIFFEEIGKKCPTSLSFSNTELTWFEKAYFSDSNTVWMMPWVNWLATYIFLFGQTN